MQNLTEIENMAIGGIGGIVEVSIMQSTNYWKNAKQQGLPFTIDPRITYRGFFSNCVNFVSCTVWQFTANGLVKKYMTGGSTRELTPSEQIGSALFAGGTSAVLCSPLELIMIQQQRKGGSLLGAAHGITKSGFSNWGRGFWMTCAREGVYTGGYLGVTPVIRSALQEKFPQWNEDGCRAIGSIFGGLFACYLSHPCDTLKTCLQGDIEGKKFSSHVSAIKTLYKEGGIASFYRGSPWRLFRQIAGIFILDKIRTNLSPVLFPHRF